MRQSLMSVVFAAALLIECYALSVASPVGKTDDGSLEQDTFASLLSDDATENGLGDADPAAAGKTRRQRVIVIADPSLWRDLRVLHSGVSLYKRRADDNSQVIEQRDAGQDLNIPILRRDTMRCMVGRVYRPCWEV
ncbi:pro-melanin-concentrating hormone, like [Perca fluviatilis]|uniref:pro-melanin-concentrating hormone, like n=1 Tax=Perca fluviatilis TaxID=8168 RepID=UPI001963B76D|nr:pro-melanin-concentrating hormone, like [Perca fluviatilis]